MPQVSIYLDQDVLEEAKRNSRRERVSLSKYISNALTQNNDDNWPSGYWELFGSLDDSTLDYPEDKPFDQVAELEV